MLATPERWIHILAVSVSQFHHPVLGLCEVSAPLIGHSHDGQTYFYRTVSKDIYSDTINLDTLVQLIFYLGRGPFARDYLCTPGKVSVVESAYCKCSA